MEAVRLYTEPKLNNPLMIAAWPGMGGVAIVAAKYLTERLEAQEFASVEPDEFFDLGGVLVENSVVKEIGIPEGKFYFYESDGENDLISFMAEAQPNMKGYGLANIVIDVAQKFGAKRLYTFAAAPTHIYHTNKPKVLAAATSPKLVQELEKYGVTLLREGSISGLNGLLLGVAKKRNIEGICLLGEIPIYTTQIANPRSSKAVLEVLTQMTGLEIDMTEIDSWAKETDKEVEEKMAHLRESFRVEARELIDYFERLAEQSSDEEMQSDFKTDELVKDIERFLREKGDRGQDKGGN
jgi:proteasome assembly chaperone (PAC2) family protein